MAPAADMFQKKIDELFHRICNVFGIADEILISGFNELGRHHYAILEKSLRICRQATLKLNRDKCLFICTSIHHLGEVILRYGVSPELRKVQVLTNMPLLMSKKELQSFLGTLNYLGKFSHQ